MTHDSTDVSDLVEAKNIEIPFPVVPQASSDRLNNKQEFDYRSSREKFARWLLLKGKTPEKIEGYPDGTAKRTLYRVAAFERFIWDTEEEYVSRPTHDHADKYIEALAYQDYSNSHKAGAQFSIQRYFNWRHHQFDGEPWTPEMTFSTGNGNAPRDFLTRKERRAIRDAALEYGTIPSYSTIQCKEERRERLKPYVAEKRHKPVSTLSVDDWEGVESWKFTTITWASLDGGLRPIEVGRATTDWVDIDNAVLRIPKDESTKNRENWVVSLREKTADALAEWLHERSHYPKYDDTNALWLTAHKNPYSSKSLGRLICRLCDRAEIPYENRKMTWYSIRHSVGTFMTREEDLAATQQQLRHKRPETTMKYDAAPPEDRRDALDRMG